MTKKIESNSNLIFCGVVSGYQGETSVTPNDAAKAVNELLATAEVFPGVCVYHTDWGCPVGGEPVGAFTLPEEIAITECEKLRVQLQQSTLAVALQSAGIPTIGFTAEATGKLPEIGKKWQEAAAKIMATTGIYVSCGIADEDDKLVISAEANPEFVKDFEAWQKAVCDVCALVGGTTSPVFAATKLNYLK